LSNLHRKIFKIILLGDGAVGKTSLRKAYLGDNFRNGYNMTIGADFAVQHINLVDGSEVNFQIWDLAGQQRFSAVREVYYRGAQGCLLVFDISRRSSFENIPSWIAEYLKCNSNQRVPVVLVGNKSDLRTSANDPVSKVQVEEYANSLSAWSGIMVPYIETSAKTEDFVNVAFSELFKKVVEFNLKRTGYHLEGEYLQNETEIESVFRRIDAKKTKVLSEFFKDFLTMELDEVLEKVQHENEVARLAIVHALGDYNNQKAISALIRFLKDDSQEIRLEAVKILGQTKSKLALKPLIEAYYEDIYLVYPEDTIIALGELGDSKAVDFLIEVLKADELDPVIIAETLVKLGDKKALIPIKEAAKRHKNKFLLSLAEEYFEDIFYNQIIKKDEEGIDKD